MNIAIKDIHKNKIKEKEETIAKYQEKIKNLNLLLKALETWEYKNIDKRFFEKYFTIIDEETGKPREYWGGKIWTMFRINNSDYSFRKYTLNGENMTLDLQERTKEHILQVVKEEAEKMPKWLKEAEQELQAIKNIDCVKLIKDMKNVFKNNGFENCKYFWIDLLKEFNYID